MEMGIKRGVWLLGLSLSLGMASASPGQLFKTAKVPVGTQVHRNLEYVKGGHERQKLDLYVPEKADGPLPVISSSCTATTIIWCRSTRASCCMTPSKVGVDATFKPVNGPTTVDPLSAARRT